MSNHYHLLIRVGSFPLVNLMSSLLSGFAGHYNRRHQRSGYVFENRYKSILCDEDSYLLELIRYIHLNPIRANIVTNLEHLDKYHWTSHFSIMENTEHAWYSTKEVLTNFGNTRMKAKANYRRFLVNGIQTKNKRNLSGGGLIRSYGCWEAVLNFRSEHVQCIGDERILGSSEFVQRALAEDELRIKSAVYLRQHGWTLNVLVKNVCNFCEISENILLSKARENNLSRAKSLICFFGAKNLDLTRSELAFRLAISPQAVAKWVKKGQSLCEKENFELKNIQL